MKVRDDKARNLMFNQQPGDDRIQHRPEAVGPFLRYRQGGAEKQPKRSGPEGTAHMSASDQRTPSGRRFTTT